MGMLKEFRDFAMRGNVVDMAVGVVIGGAFGAVVKSLVDDIFSPAIGAAAGGIDFSNKAITVANPLDAAKPVLIAYGKFINVVIAFMIVAFCLFLIVKLMNTLMRKSADAPPPPAPPTKEQELLTEIRDLLRTQRG